MPTYKNDTTSVIRYRGQKWEANETLSVMFYVPASYGLTLTSAEPVPPLIVYSERIVLATGTVKEYSLDTTVAPPINNVDRKFRTSIVVEAGNGYLYKNAVTTTPIALHEKLMYRSTDEEYLLSKVLIKAEAELDYTINIERADYLKW